jgi:peptidoglycan/LPS O-acetylase OafA/YrhL
VRRIFPALFVVLSFTLAAGWFLLMPVDLRSLGKHVTAGAGFLANVALWRESGYFDRAVVLKPLVHLWSLGVEEQYYLVWPVLILTFRRSRSLLLLVIAMILGLSFVWSLGESYAHPSAAFYLPFSRFWELASGGLLAVSSAGGREGGDARWHDELLAALGLATILVGFVTIRSSHPFPGIAALMPVLGALALISSGPGSWLARRVLSRPVAVWVGLISYPLYLWHWPLFSLTRNVIGETPDPWLRIGLVVASFALAHTTYRFVELPVRRWVDQGSRIVALAGAVGVVGALGFVTYASDGFPGRVGGRPESLPVPPAEGPCPAGLAVPPGREAWHCSSSRGEAPTAILIGDSHARSLFSGLARATSESWLLASQASCPPLLGTLVESDVPGCVATNRRVLSWLRSPESRGIRTVVLSFFSGYALDTPFAADHVAGGAGPIALDGHTDEARKIRSLEIGLDAYVREVIATGRSLTLVEDWPELPFFPTRCAEGLGTRSKLRDLLVPGSGCGVDLSIVGRRQASYVGVIERIRSRHPELSVVRSLDVLCVGGGCPAERDGVLLYDDSHHLSAGGAFLVAEELITALGEPGRR